MKRDLLGTRVPFPQFPRKHREGPLFTATEFWRYAARREGRPLPRCPRSVVLVYGRSWRTYLPRRYGRPILAGYGLYPVSREVGVSCVTGAGAPNSALYVEELAAAGARRFVIVGMAGSLQRALRVGSMVVCTKALRDEGTSHHYARSGAFAYPTPQLVSALGRTLERHHVSHVDGSSWTTDALYRETVAEVRRYRKRGILTVEMEAAAVFAVARSLGCESAALFVISDHLHEQGWEPLFHDSRRELRRALSLAAEAVSRRPGRAGIPR